MAGLDGRAECLELLIAFLQERGFAGEDEEPVEIDDGDTKKGDGRKDGGGKKPAPKDDKPVVVKERKVTREEIEQIARALQQLVNRANRERGGACCDNMLVPVVSGITVQRKLANGTFETPVNGLFDVGDTITVGCDILACPPLDIHVHLIELSDQSSTRVLSLAGVTRGADLAADQRHPNDPGSHRFSKEIDLSQTRFSISASPAGMALSVSVRDVCKRVATATLPLTFVDFS
ncbi:hypothetical protein [Breoghania sp. L-A4]|uniref:hypothetical protein n=1 Tax=Breoghania sp. L-A4 TaxID=2304600 RepID=UPI000E359BFD|nr:hypothetical protein [Breoghania sp. L-A4]AXS39519.1 hypothetical protein D1F64_04955 [Breoghania sp. L-A4]